jgi:hypothetical protein
MNVERPGGLRRLCKPQGDGLRIGVSEVQAAEPRLAIGPEPVGHGRDPGGWWLEAEMAWVGAVHKGKRLVGPGEQLHVAVNGESAEWLEVDIVSELVGLVVGAGGLHLRPLGASECLGPKAQ